MLSLKPLFGRIAYLGLSLKEVSEKSGVPYITLCNMRKTNKFTTSAIDKLCCALNLNISDVMRFDF